MNFDNILFHSLKKITLVRNLKDVQFMSQSEIISIMVLFDLRGFKLFKHSYVFMFKNIQKLSFLKRCLEISLLNLCKLIYFSKLQDKHYKAGPQRVKDLSKSSNGFNSLRLELKHGKESFRLIIY